MVWLVYINGIRSRVPSNGSCTLVNPSTKRTRKRLSSYLTKPNSGETRGRRSLLFLDYKPFSRTWSCFVFKFGGSFFSASLNPPKGGQFRLQGSDVNVHKHANPARSLPIPVYLGSGTCYLIFIGARRLHISFVIFISGWLQRSCTGWTGGKGGGHGPHSSPPSNLATLECDTIDSTRSNQRHGPG